MEITSEELQEKINNGEKLILKLGASWCKPCSVLKPIFEKVAKENTSDVQMYSFDVDLSKEIAISLGIRSVPTIKTFNMGKNIDTKVGLINEGQIKDLIEGLING
jgi:thioredoxin 1